MRLSALLLIVLGTVLAGCVHHANTPAGGAPLVLERTIALPTVDVPAIWYYGNLQS